MTENALQMKKDFIEKNIGQKHEVIIENMKNGFYLAHTKNFILCYIESQKPLKENSYQTVIITELFEDGARAEIV